MTIDPKTTGKLIIGIKSCAKNQKKMDVIRNTWLKDIDQTRTPAFFYIGQPGVEEQQDGDLLLLDAKDTYEALPLKIYALFKYLLNHMEFDYYFNVDDDVFVDYSGLLQAIEEDGILEIGDYLGNIRFSSFRFWHIENYTEYSRKLPRLSPSKDFCLGNIYFLSRHAIQKIIETHDKTFFEEQIYDDMAIARSLRKNNITPKQIPQFQKIGGAELDEAAINTLYASRGQKPSKISCLCIVDGHRLNQLKRAIVCFQQQLYSNKELIIVFRESEQDMMAFSQSFTEDHISFVSVPESKPYALGNLKNIAIRHSSGDYLTWWYPDVIHHPDRIAKQQFCTISKDACILPDYLAYDNQSHLVYPCNVDVYDTLFFKRTLIDQKGIESVDGSEETSVIYGLLEIHADDQLVQWLRETDRLLVALINSDIYVREIPDDNHFKNKCMTQATKRFAQQSMAKFGNQVKERLDAMVIPF